MEEPLTLAEVARRSTAGDFITAMAQNMHDLFLELPWWAAWASWPNRLKWHIFRKPIGRWAWAGCLDSWARRRWGRDPLADVLWLPSNMPTRGRKKTP